MRTRRAGEVVLGAVVGLWLAACGGDKVQVRGHVTNGGGQQSQGLTDGAPALGGDGTASATTTVRISRVVAAGDLTTLAEADVAADGSYTLELDDAGQRLIIEAVNKSGVTVGSALLDSTAPQSGQDVRTAPPITSESSLEAEVYVQMVRDGETPDNVDTVDLRARLNVEQAAAVRGQLKETATESVKALGAAVRAAQATRIKAYARAGVVITQDQLFSASLDAAAKLDAALDAGGQAAQAYDAFFAEVRAATPQASDVQDQQAEREASVAYRMTVDARLSTGAGAAVADASARSAAALEARATEAAVKALLQAASATDTVLAQANTAATALRTNLAGATSAGAAATAWTSFDAQLATSGSASVMGAYLGVTSSNQLAFDSAVNSGAQASAALDASLGTVLEQAGRISAAALSDAVVSAFTTYDAAARGSAAATLTSFGARTNTGVELLIISQGSFRLR
ncbi:hypothetical protein JYK02_08355 [Corallococcus macrosporus]|uniref:Uncharacterized protein n=1 Tax=Corallococcus macrosporus TaxID=35 RepID=A0ABS3D9G5_9BACT|nr:hypothetical protein [Corallococcus macrosporus]MBN8227516.1 hypothetical protein [Corallococcus macrosporus]